MTELDIEHLKRRVAHLEKLVDAILGRPGVSIQPFILPADETGSGDPPPSGGGPGFPK